MDYIFLNTQFLNTILLEGWKKLLDDVKWENIVELTVERADEPIERLMAFVELHRDFFSIETKPVSFDPIKDHLKSHFTDVNEFVHEGVLAPRDAMKLVELVYLYDSVLPYLAETSIEPKEYPDLGIDVLMIPEPLYDWMFKLDYLWEKLFVKRKLGRDLLNHLEFNKREFMNKALELKVFLPIPTKDPLQRIPPDIEKMWFRRYNVNWKDVHYYLYTKVSKMLLENVL